MSSIGVMIRPSATPGAPSLPCRRLVMAVPRIRAARTAESIRRLARLGLLPLRHDAELDVFEAGPLAGVELVPHVAVACVLVGPQDDDDLDLADRAAGPGRALDALLLAHQEDLQLLRRVEHHVAERADELAAAVEVEEHEVLGPHVERDGGA